MPCTRTGHVHVWKTEGELTIERCEKECGFCGKSFKHAWFVRRHVYDVHRKQLPGLILNPKWSGSPAGNRKAGSASTNGHRRNTSSVSTMSMESDASGPGTVMQSIEPDFNTTIPFSYSFGVGGTEMPLPVPDMTMPLAQTVDPLDLSAPIVPPGNVSWGGVFDASPPSGDVGTRMWVTPQSARTSGIWIEGALPPPAHHGMAKHFVTGLNELVTSAMASGSLKDGEILHVLETYTDAFRWGIGSPVPESVFAELSEKFPSPVNQG